MYGHVAVNPANLFYPAYQKQLEQHGIKSIEEQIYGINTNPYLTLKQKREQIKSLEEQLRPRRPTGQEWERQQMGLREQAEWNRLPPEEQERQAFAFLNAETKRREAEKKKSMCEQLGSCSVMGGSRRSKKTRKSRSSKRVTHKRRK